MLKQGTGVFPPKMTTRGQQLIDLHHKDKTDYYLKLWHILPHKVIGSVAVFFTATWAWWGGITEQPADITTQIIKHKLSPLKPKWIMPISGKSEQDRGSPLMLEGGTLRFNNTLEQLTPPLLTHGPAFKVAQYYSRKPNMLRLFW